MPFLNTDASSLAGTSSTNLNLGASANLTDIQRVSQLTQQHDYGILSTIAGDVGLGALDLVDTVGSSIPLVSRGLGIKRGDFNQMSLRALDSPGLTDFYNQNRGGIEAASGIVGVIAAELVTRKLTKPAGLLMSGLKTLPYARRIATLDAEYATAMQTVRLADKELASRGAMGIEQYIGRVGVEGGGMQGLLGGVGGTTRSAATRKANWLGFAKGAKNAGLTEVTMAVTLNQNDFLYSDDMSHNIMWMGLGLGIGGAFEKVATGYAIRKYVNSDEIRRTFANALDPDKTEAARLLWRDNIPKGLMSKQALADTENLGFLGGSTTDYVTNLLVGARTREKTPLGTSEFAQGLQSSRTQLATQDLQLAREEIQKVTTKGISTNGFTRFGNGSKGYMNHLDQVMHHDPGSMMGIEQLGGIPEELSAVGIHNSHFQRLEEVISDLKLKAAEEAEAIKAGTKKGKKFDFDANDELIRRFTYERDLTPVFFIDGERATLTDARVLDGWHEPTILKSAADDETDLFEAINKEGGSHKVGVDTNLKLYLPANKPIGQADHYDLLRAYRAGQRAIQALKNKAEIKIALPKGANYFELDMAEQLIRESDGRAQITWPEAMTRESAQVESFAQKAEILRSESRKLKIRQLNEVKKGTDYDPALEASKLRVRLNLPKLTAYERGVLGESEHPTMQLLRGVSEMDPKEMRNLTKQDLMLGAAQVKRIGDFAPTAASDFDDLMGNSFRYMLDDEGQVTRPLIGYQRSLQPFEWTPDNLADRLATRKMFTVTKMMEPLQTKQGAKETFTNALSKALMQTPDFDQVSRTHELMDPQVQGSVLGTANQTPFGAVAKAVKSRDWIGRDTPIMLAASRVQELAQRLTRDFFQREAQPLQQIAGVLNSPRNASTKLLLNQFIAHRPGWDIALDGRKAVEASLSQVAMPGGKTGYKFLLQRTEKNMSRWKTMFGQEMPEGAIMPTPDGRDIVLDQTGLDFMKAFNTMTDSLRENKNQLLRANGLNQIDRMDFYVPPTNIDGKFIGFTLDAENKVVPGMTVIATTQEQFAKEQAKINLMISDQKKVGYRFMTRDQIQRRADIWDRAQMDMIDPGTTAIQPGKRGTGGLSSVTIDPQGVEGVLSTLRSQYFNHTGDIVTTMFKDQIKSAESRSAVASDVTRNRAGFYRDQQFRSIHDMYLENLLGKSPLNSSGSLVGRFYNQIEGTIDAFLASGAPSVSKTWHATNQWIDKVKPWDKSPLAKRDFESLTSALGEHMPFKSAAEYLENQGAGQMPPKLKDIMGTMNRFTAATMLRIFEPAMAVMNMAGMVNAMPSVIRHLAMREGEDVAAHAARVGHIATIFPGAGPNGGSIGVLDMAKIMTRGAKRAWSKASHVDYDYMRSQGFLTQEVAEFQKQFGAIETKADWERFMFGAPGTKVGKTGQDGAFLGEKGLVGWLSILTDKSEDFSRSWGHMAGLELADHLGIAGVEARNSFAHDMANKMIANYNPANRPEVFQGAIGAPLGLFQSFIMNYYQRLFRYVETKDFASLGTQYAMQGSLFGVTTLPGWAEANKFFFSHSNGEQDVNDTIREKFGQATGDLLAAGTISNVPKLFGLPGVDLYSRGDTSVRLPGLNLPPGITVAEKVISGVSEGLKAAFGGLTGANPALTGTQMAEIASNTIPNRPIAGMVEQFFAGGNDTDQYGQVVADTKSMAEGAYRVLGVRSMRQSKELQAFYANRNAMELKAGQDDMLRTATRAAIRGGNMDQLPQIMAKYIETGGDPRYFRRWLKSNYEAATETRGERQLATALKGDQMGYVARLLDAGVSIKGDDETIPYSESLESPSNFDHVNEDLPDYGGNQTFTPGAIDSGQ